VPPESSPRGDQGVLQLNLCWTWLCPKCQHRNYHHGARKLTDISPEEIQAACEHLGVEDKDGLLVMPTSCYCVKCESTFVLAAPAEEDT
jgi:hypothetical protein